MLASLLGVSVKRGLPCLLHNNCYKDFVPCVINPFIVFVQLAIIALCKDRLNESTYKALLCLKCGVILNPLCSRSEEFMNVESERILVKKKLD